MEKVNHPFVFQSDSPIVKAEYESNDNFLIEYDSSNVNTFCAIYFCSNNIYYPNTEISFRSNIINMNRYEWYGTRVKYAYKHIFIRDIKKQWYLTGINAGIDSPDALLSFLKKQTNGYKIVALGSSAGGYAATLYGSLLNAQLILSFNGQFEIQSLLQNSTELINPILFRFYKNKQFLEFFDTKPFIKDGSNIYYFYSNKSAIDLDQKEYINNIGLNLIGFNTRHHGVPFLKCNLPVILEKSPQELVRLVGKIHNPLSFSIQTVGLKKTVIGLLLQVIKRFF